MKDEAHSARRKRQKNVNKSNLKTPWKPGQSGNPDGRPAGRVMLTADFWKALAADFKVHGVAAIEAARVAEPATYFKTVASLMPREIDVKHELERMSDDDIYRAIAELRTLIAAGGVAEADTGEVGGAEAGGVSTLQ